jgi:hypothetical protein
MFQAVEDKKDDRNRLAFIIREVDRFLSDGLVKVIIVKCGSKIPVFNFLSLNLKLYNFIQQNYWRYYTQS